jgi:glycosyltransferase involved in cell wall biosynthesis
MTPLGPEGQNGGAGLVATSLVRHLSALAPELQFTLLTSAPSHAELSTLEAPNVKRLLLQGPATVRSLCRRLSSLVLPPRAWVRVRRALRSISTSRDDAELMRRLQPDLLFCPFTVPYHWQPGLRCISTLYDLQHLTYPEFFTPEQRLNRQRDVVDACARSDWVVCISEYVRGTLSASLAACAERAVTVPLGLLQTLDAADASVLSEYGLEPGQFLLYPANFWPHKNHKRLFEALQIYNQSRPDSPLKLVCTGAPDDRMVELEKLATSLFQGKTVTFTGYVAQEQLAALLAACKALTFPSLYEGFGMPVLEAMAHGKPVLCSNVTSLPEVAGDAATYFDPTNAQEIAAAIAALDDHPTIAERIASGRRRAAQLGTARDMAKRYLQLFETTLAAPVSA